MSSIVSKDYSISDIYVNFLSSWNKMIISFTTLEIALTVELNRQSEVKLLVITFSCIHVEI